MGDFEVRARCSLCRSHEVVPCFSLGRTPIANEFVRDPGAEKKDDIPLELFICRDCGHLQSSIVVPAKRLYGNYVYASSTSPLTVAHLRDEARTINAVLNLRGRKTFVVEVGSNDGTFLEQMVSIGIPSQRLLGIDPAASMAEVASKKGINTHVDFFSRRCAESLRDIYEPADVVVANNVFAHVPDVRDCLEGVKVLLGDDGVLVMEVAHAGDLLLGAWDTIYHEHLSHHAFAPLARTLESIGLPVFNIETTPSQIGRGSLRVWAGKNRRADRRAESAISVLTSWEEMKGLGEVETWRDLQKKIEGEGDDIRLRLMVIQKNTKRKIFGYGAPAKMTTLVYGYGLQHLRVSAVADDSSHKQGLYTPGTRWPVVSLEELVAGKPDLVILFAWNFADDMRRKLKDAGYAGQALTPQEIAAGAKIEGAS